MSKPLRFAIVGTGRMGLRRLQAILDHPNAEAILVADDDAALARDVAAKSGCASTSDYRAAVANSEVDCVVVAVPNHLHQSVVLDALGQGKHTFCEKPLARTPDEALSMVRAAADNRVFLKVGSNLRYFPNVRKAHELLAAGAIGEITFFRGWIGHDGWALASWWSDPRMVGGGTFLDNGCHLLDLARWFLGEPIECSGWTSTLVHAVEPLEDNGMGIFRFGGGKLAFVHSSWSEWAGYAYMEIYGADGYLRIDSRGSGCSVVHGHRGSEELFDFSAEPPLSFTWEVDDFVDAISCGRQPLPSGLDGLRAVQMAYAVYESSRTGRTQPLWGREEQELAELVEAVA